MRHPTQRLATLLAASLLAQRRLAIQAD